MRPDEHKQKKNAVYKKKHGIGVKDSSCNDKNKKISKTKEETASRSSGHITAKSKVADCSHSDDEENVVAETKTKGFQRRQIVSNWEKYEIEREDEVVADGGKDYGELLSMAGEAMSHFRLTDELDWDEHQTIEGGDPGSNFVLSLDPQDIARSLSCLPVHSVLGIPQDMVSEDDLSLAAKCAMENESKFCRNNSDSTFTHESVKQENSSVPESSPDWSKSPIRSSKVNGNVSSMKVDADCGLEANERKCDSSSYTAEHLASSQGNNIDDMEDELDALLDLDEP